MAKRPFLLLYINDFLGSPIVQAMNDAQVRWYLYLLMRAWQAEPACHLPNDDQQLMILAGCKSKAQWGKFKGLVLSQFDLDETKKYLTNSRLIAEYQKMCVISDKRRDAANKRKQMQSNCSTSVEQKPATLTPTQTLTKPKSKPSPASGSDPRHTPVKEFVKKCCEYKKVPFTWEGGEASALASFLKGNPNMPEEELFELVRRRFNSKDPPGDRPRIWIGNLGRYATEGGNHGSKQEQRTSKNISVIGGVLSGLTGGDGRLPQGRSKPDDGKGLVRRPQPVLGSGDP